MKLKEILKDIEILGMTADPETEVGDIAYDSRAVRPGSLFAAIVGMQSDGHRFIPMAAEKGATAVLCQTLPETDIPYVQVADTRCALAIASRNLFGDPAGKMCMIAVTGTNGKTTSTYLIKHILEERLGAKVGLVGTNGNRIGDTELPSERTTPESYELHKLFARMYAEGCTHVVMEVSSHALSLERVAGIRYKVAVFTNLTQDHLDFHGTMEEYAAAKARLFAQTEQAVINYDDPYGAYMAGMAKCPVTSYSVNSNDADLLAKDLKLLPGCVRFCAVATGEIERVTLGIPGRFNVYNALGVIACCMCLGISMPDCAASLATAGGVKGRAETVPTDGDYSILIDYSHTPDSLENILRTVRETTSGRVVAVFGCGGDRDRTKRPIMGRIGTELADFAVITSDNPRTEDPEAIIEDILKGVTVGKNAYAVIPDREKAIEYAIVNHRPGDVIVLAGKGHETYQEVGHEKRHMDEREIVAKIIEKRKNK